MGRKELNKLDYGSEEKIRIRTEKELHLQNEGLLLIKRILDELGCSWFVTGGTLLGAVREKDFIKWDWDVEVSLLTEEILDQEGRLLILLQKNGFEIAKVDRTYDNYKVVAEQFGAVYEFLARHKIRGMRARKYTVVPAKFFECAEKIEFRGTCYPCPSPPEDYLTYLYGDWETPKRTTDKKKYFSDQAYIAKDDIHGQRFFVGRVIRRAKRLLSEFGVRRAQIK